MAYGPILTDKIFFTDYVYVTNTKQRNNFDPSTIKKVIFNNPVTVVIWNDDSKTIVRCQEGDEYNKETGLAMAIIKKCCGNKGNYNNVFEKWVN